MSVPIPGEILKSEVIFGLSFDELVGLGTVPLVLILPTVFFDFIPLWVTGGVLIIGVIGMVGIVLKSPRGQSPVEWFPAYVDRRLKPDVYTIKPKDGGKNGIPEIKYLDVMHTEKEIRKEDDMDFTAEEFRAVVEDIDHADKLELPEWAEEEDDVDEKNRLIVDVLIVVKNRVVPSNVANKVSKLVGKGTQ